ncbi:hypothetical protein [Roseibacillus ishigakijimensis]|uniref:Uncharacterized protein n=1 Tax=Roseibacillus ishigakijimensis TaxID=454146 RepID=A0A934RU14_9BACT|nr:hypothetical protein [Roseibacillus ishigakijimensis]MBK1834486.1 hypothetical protein [Roseibacillus ishigakijimensis]
MKKKLIMGAGLLGVAVALFVWGPRPQKPDSEAVERESKSDFAESDALPGFKSRRDRSVPPLSPEDLEGRPSVLSGEPVVIREGERFEDLAAEEKARIAQQQEEIAGLIARQQNEAFEDQLAFWTGDLNLTLEQVAALRAAFAEVQGAIASGDLQAHGQLALLLQGEGLADFLGEVLTPAQKDLLASSAQRRLEADANAAVASEMNQVNQLLNLKPQQKERMEEILYEQKLAAQAGGATARSEEEQIAQAEALRNEMANAAPGENPLEAMLKARFEQIRESQLEQLAEVLTAEQLEIYRQSLEAREDLSPFAESLKAYAQDPVLRRRK